MVGTQEMAPFVKPGQWGAAGDYPTKKGTVGLGLAKYK